MIEQKRVRKHRVKDAQKGRLDGHKTSSVLRPVYCQDCEHSKTHATGSQLWLSCRLQKGWRSISSQCNLPQKEMQV